MRRLIGYVVAATLLGGHSLAQVAPAAPAGPTSRILFSVIDEKGEPVEISKNDLTIEVRGHPATLGAITHYREAPLRIVIVLDHSGSMSTQWDAELLILFQL